MKMKAEILAELVKDIELYRAHKTKDKTHYESLVEHTALTLEKFRYICAQKHIDMMFDRLQLHLMPQLSSQGIAFWHQMIEGIPVFHDIGKINPKFQKQKMDNENISDWAKFKYIGSAHSVISALLYIDYWKKAVRSADGLTKTDKAMLNPLIMLHSYIIARHHSNLLDLNEYLNVLSGSSINHEDSSKGVQEVIDKFENKSAGIYLGAYNTTKEIVKSRANRLKDYLSSLSDENSIYVYIYGKMLYSLLVASDYYATAAFMSNMQIKQLGNIDDIKICMDVYENTGVMKAVRKYQSCVYPRSRESLQKSQDINELRCEIFCDAEKNLLHAAEQNVFFLEAPTGSGKSNTAFNLSFQLMKRDNSLKKIYYIYPFNTLVEQNLNSLKKIFGDADEVMDNIAVINSLTPIKCAEDGYDNVDRWQKALLDRQFLNYPIILSTHVSLFNTMFGCNRELAFGFYQLMNSVIVLDEIQSYRNEIWSEMINFLKGMAELLHMKIIIMSATLPNLDYLANMSQEAVMLLPDKDKYFSHRCFKERVAISYDMLDEQYTDIDSLMDVLIGHLRQDIACNKKIMMEFISKKTAYAAWEYLQNADLGCELEYMSGDDSVSERERILTKVKEAEQAIVLVATQVIEAGVDIDMDIGYKNISKLDSEEQFMGRINRSCLRCGTVHFFKLDNCRYIYKKDVRVNPKLTLENEDMRAILTAKDYGSYYAKVMKRIKSNINSGTGKGSIAEFFTAVKLLKWQWIAEKMKLIEDDQWNMQVYLARNIELEDGSILSGEDIWQKYKMMLNDSAMDYAEKRIKLSRIRAKMNNFIYQIKYNPSLSWDDKCGEIFFIREGERFFTGDKLNRAKIQGEIGEFVDFI